MNPIKRVPPNTSLQRNEQGLSTVEYVIILMLIAVAGMSVWKQFGDAIRVQVRDATTDVNSL